MRTVDVATAHGPARVHLRPVDEPRGALVLGHGAGGGVGARDLVAATEAALAEGLAVALVEQPYRVAGKRSAPRAPQLDAAWVAVLEHLATVELQGLPLVTGGRSAGARVACRTAAETGAAGVLCLAFPLEPPGGRASRLAELDAVQVPTLVVQGERDPYGMPPAARTRTVARVPGDHALRNAEPVRDAVGAWLAGLLSATASPGP